MTDDLVINLGDNVTLTIKEQQLKSSYFDRNIVCPLNATIILCSCTIILIIVAASSICTSLKQSNPTVIIVIRLLALAYFSECIIGRTLSIVFAILYSDQTPSNFLCRISAASTIFSVILESFTLSSIAIPKFPKKRLRLWISAFITVAMSVPILFMSSNISVRYFISRNSCLIVADTNMYYIVVLLVLVLLPSWVTALYFRLSYTYKDQNEVNNFKHKDFVYLSFLDVLYSLFVLPNIISIIFNGFTNYNGVGKIESNLVDFIFSWLPCFFWFIWPLLTLFMYSSIFLCIKSLLCEFKTFRTLPIKTRTKDIYSDYMTPILFATNHGLFLRNFAGEQQIDLTILSNVSSKNSNQPSLKLHSDKTENQIRKPRRKMVRFATNVVQIPETFKATYKVLPTRFGSYSSSCSSSSATSM